MARLVLALLCIIAVAVAGEELSGLQLPHAKGIERMAADTAAAWGNFKASVEEEAAALKAAADGVANTSGTKFYERLRTRSQNALAALVRIEVVFASPLIQLIESLAEAVRSGEIGGINECDVDDGECDRQPERTVLRRPTAWAPRCRWDTRGLGGAASTASIVAGDPLGAAHSSEKQPPYGGFGDLLTHLARDWGGGVAQAVYTLHYRTAISALEQHLYAGINDLSRVLVPGSGVGRLAMEIAALENVAEVVSTECSAIFAAAQEATLQMAEPGDDPTGLSKWWDEPLPLWGGSFGSLVHGDGRDQFANTTLNRAGTTLASQMARTSIRSKYRTVQGDIFDTSAETPTAGFDAVVTSFLIDAVVPSKGQSFLEILRRIDALMAPGGLWVNLGPLYYHADSIMPKMAYEEIVSFFVDVLGYSIVEPPRKIDSVRVPYARDADTTLTPHFHTPMLSVLRKGLI